MDADVQVNGSTITITGVSNNQGQARVTLFDSHRAIVGGPVIVATAPPLPAGPPYSIQWVVVPGGGTGPYTVRLEWPSPGFANTEEFGGITVPQTPATTTRMKGVASTSTGTVGS